MTQTLFDITAPGQVLPGVTLGRAGAVRTADGAYRLNGFSLRIEGDDWLRLTNLKATPGTCSGAWKPGAAGRPVCDVPWLGNSCFAGTDSADGVIACLNWASDTASAKASASAPWSAPALPLVRELLDGCRMEIEVRGLTRGIELIHEPGRLNLRSILASCDGTLDPARRAVLGGVVADANERWRMVRASVSSDVVSMEVDLTGVSADVLAGSGVLRMAHHCLSAAASAMVECIHVLADSSTQISLCPFLVDRASSFPTLFPKEQDHEERIG